MKKLVFAILFPLHFLSGQNTAESCNILNKINRVLQREHVRPKPVDDSLSVYVFDHLIDEIDPSRNILLKSEYDALATRYRMNLDNLILSNKCDFIADIDSKYKTGLLRVQKALEKIKQSPINYGIKDTVRLYKKAFDFYLTKENVEKVWTKKLRYQILEDLVDSGASLDSLTANFVALESTSKRSMIEDELCRINSLLQEKSAHEDLIYNLFCSYFDPHTAYFNDDSKSNFVASLSKEHLSLGMNVNVNDKNQIIIDEIDANGPAFESGLLKKGDQIIAISNQLQKLEISCTPLDEVSKMMLSEQNKEITLTVKRAATKIFDVTIKKQIIRDEENSVYSFVVGQKSKIGYIKIPSFYADLDGNSRKGCADDVAREMMKLEKDKIKGLVIDLIDNGGGSMEEAVKLAGFFIDRGPLSIVVEADQSKSLITDPFDGMIYKGPIIVLINSNTASASEFFASILQDYNRALLLGSSTLGKATMQTILPLDRTAPDSYVKVTINKFYRITGKSHQSIGVQPDVILPEFYENIYTKEQDLPTAIANDSLNFALPYKPYVKDDVIDKIAKSSKENLYKNPYFESINDVNKRIDSLVNKPKTEIPLTLAAVFDQKKNQQELIKEIDAFNNKNDVLEIYNSTTNQDLLLQYPTYQAANQSKIDNLKVNAYLTEAISIIDNFNASLPSEVKAK